MTISMKAMSSRSFCHQARMIYWSERQKTKKFNLNWTQVLKLTSKTITIQMMNQMPLSDGTTIEICPTYEKRKCLRTKNSWTLIRLNSYSTSHSVSLLIGRKTMKKFFSSVWSTIRSSGRFQSSSEKSQSFKPYRRSSQPVSQIWKRSLTQQLSHSWHHQISLQVDSLNSVGTLESWIQISIVALSTLTSRLLITKLWLKTKTTMHCWIGLSSSKYWSALHEENMLTSAQRSNLASLLSNYSRHIYCQWRLDYYQFKAGANPSFGPWKSTKWCKSTSKLFESATSLLQQPLSTQRVKIGCCSKTGPNRQSTSLDSDWDAPASN